MSPQVAFLLSRADESIRNLHFEAANLYLSQAQRIQPNNFEVLRLIGVVHALRGEYSEALDFFEKVIALSPRLSSAYSNKGNVLKELGRYEESIICYDKAIALQSDNHEAYSNKGNVLQEQKKYEEALINYNKSLALKSTAYETYVNKGIALKELKRIDESMDCYKKALELNPMYSDAWLGMGWAYHAIREHGEAKKYLEKAIDINPNNAQAQENLACVELTQMNFSNGWHRKEYRWLTKSCNSVRLNTSKPQWDGAQMPMSLFIWAEQGIGDQVLYASMFHELINTPQKKIVSVEAKLLPIFKRSFSGYEFIGKETAHPEANYNEHIPIGSLGGIFRNSLEDFQRARHPYIFDDAVRTQSIKSRPEFKNKITCGVSWGSSNRKVGDDKSIPIEDLYPILKMNNIEFVNLQYGDVKSTLIKAKEEIGNKIINLDEVDLFEDVDGALSIIAACDIIVTSSNSTAHLAGALGKETLLLVPYSVGQFWYWHAIDGKSIWYPSVRVFEQEQQGDWSAPVNAVKQYLERRFG
jgi:tetratricopeptide (TPR) repeat protein